MATADELRALAEQVMELEASADDSAIFPLGKAVIAACGYDDAEWPHCNPLASLDAAMTLVPEGKEWSWDVASGGRASVTRHTENALHWETATAATPALALTAAALLARAEALP